MISFLAGLFSQQNFIPHGFCLAWEPGLLGLHVISDSVIAISYYTIPFALLYLSPGIEIWRFGASLHCPGRLSWPAAPPISWVW